MLPNDPYQNWLPIVLMEATVYDPTLPGTRTLYWSDREFMTGASDTPASQPYLERLTSPGILAIDLLEAWSKGIAPLGIGGVVLTNQDHALDVYRRYTFDGFPVTIYVATRSAAGVLTKTKLFTGFMDQPDVGDTINLTVRNAAYGLDKPIVRTAFLGTGGVEGDAGLKGRMKPRLYGWVSNLTPLQIDATNNVWFVADRNVVIINAYDGGVTLSVQAGGGGAGQYTTYANLMAAALASGKWAWCDDTAGSFVRLGTAPTAGLTLGLVRDSVVASAGAKPDSIIGQLLSDGGAAVTTIFRDFFYPVSSPGSFNSTFINGMATGRYVDDNATTYADVIGDLCASFAGWIWYNHLGPYWILQNLPDFDNQGSVTTLVTDPEISDFVKLGQPKIPGRGLPPTSLTIRYNRNLTVQTSGLNAAAPLSYRTYAGLEWQETVKSDASVLTRYPSADSVVVDRCPYETPASTYVTTTDLRDRYWNALSLGWDYYRITLPLSAKLLSSFNYSTWIPAIMPPNNFARLGVRSARFGFTNTGNGTEVTPVNVSLDLKQKLVTMIVRTTYEVG